MLDSQLELELSSFSKEKRTDCLERLSQDRLIEPEIIQILLSIENVPCTITDYRDRERYLEDLLKTTRTKLPDESIQEQVLILRYLLGSLYVNFEKFWGPTIRVIIDILNVSKKQQELIKTILIHLEETSNLIYECKSSPSSLDDSRADHILHRNFLFQILHKFTSYLENNSEIFMTQFLRFIKEELLVSPFIEKYTTENLIKIEDRTEEEDNVYKVSEIGQKHQTPGEDHNISNDVRKSKSKPKRKSLTKAQKQKSKETFLTAAHVIQSFTTMQRIYKHEELKGIILDLLCCRDCSIQKAAFKCLLVYDDEHIRPYVDKFMKIMSDKMVRTELTLFSIEESNSIEILGSHRAQMMPILLRVLFGKMIGKIGKRSSGREKADYRKTLIMRFIAGCSSDEIVYFFSLLFDPVFSDARTSYDKLESTLVEKLVLTKYIPLNKIQAMLSSLSAYINSVAHLQEGSLAYVLKFINIMLFYVTSPLEKKDLLFQISTKNVTLLRALRRTCITITTEFFQTFEYYKFNQEEINFTFKHLIWTSTSGFIDKNYASPTPILRLIETFACHNRYHKLLVKRNKTNQDEYLLKHLIDLYADPKTTRSVLKFIASVLGSIINSGKVLLDDSQTDQVEIQVDLLEDEDSLIPYYARGSYNLGAVPIPFEQEILIGFIPIIFDRLKKNCVDFVSKKDAEFRLENNELTVLSTLSIYLKDPDQSLLGVELLLTTLKYQKKSILILNTLKTAQVLLKQVNNISKSNVIPLIADMLSYQRNLEQRKELCILVEILSDIEFNLRQTSVIIKLLNATRISMDNEESADLVIWNEGFQSLFLYLDQLDESTINQKELVTDSFVLILHQIGFIVNSIDKYDFSVRENCLIFYEKIARKIRLVRAEQNRDFLKHVIDDILLEKYVKKGLRETNDAIKHTCLSILRSLAKECHEKHDVLAEFHLFCNDQPDLDFWLNIRHIQLHHRSKALARLIANQDLRKVSPKTLSSYFMPLAAGFLFSKTYKSVASLTENSIKLIGIICKKLNWITYKSTLNYYLDLLTKANTIYQRTNIKLITEILKNFNFDLTACKEAKELDEENAKLEKRMKKRVGIDGLSCNVEVIATDAPVGKRLNPSTAKMVYFSVTKQILPRLNSSLHEMTRVEFEHDKQMADYLPEKDEIKRIPIAFAIVQLLNLLPGRHVLFRDQLPSLFLKLTSFLKSKTEIVRKVSRATLIKIMSFVGPAYLPDLLRVLKQNLDKGFQIHVLNYTVHSVLEKLPLYYGSLDHSTEVLVNSCFQEIFGKLAEDKEVARILAKTFEAKKTKSFDTLMILSVYISFEKLTYLMNSVKEVLKHSVEPRQVNKVSVCLQKIFTGLSKNEKFPLDRMLSFIRLVIEESIPSLKIRQVTEQAENSVIKPAREDRFLISKDQTRDRVKSKINEKGNFHMVVENSLRLLLVIFQKNKILLKRKENLKKKLDELVKLLNTTLKSSSPKCVMRSLKCIYFIAQAKSDLPNLKSHGNLIVKRIFTLLNMYNGVGMVQGDNLEMINMCFKTLTLLLLRCSYVELNDAQVNALMSYIAQDLHDSGRQTTAFGALHSLLKKKCSSTELPTMMNTVAELLITSDDESVRTISAKIWETYLLEYKHEGNKLRTHLTRFLRQLDYEFIDGRKAVLKVLNIVIMRFPEQLLRDYFELMFHLLSQRVVNEESKEVRDIVSRLLGLMIQRLPEKRSYIFNKFIIPWASGSSCQLQILGIKLLSILVESSKAIFDKGKLRRTLEMISRILEQGKANKSISVTNTNENDTSAVEETKVKDGIASYSDRLDYHTLRLFKRLLTKDLVQPVETRFLQELKLIWQNIAQHKINDWYSPVSVTACELYLIFIKKTPLVDSLNVQDPATDNYLDWNAKTIVRSLCDSYMNLLDGANESSYLLSIITESMISLGQLVANSKSSMEFEEDYCKSFSGDIIERLVGMKDLPNDGLVQECLPYNLTVSKKKVNLIWMAIKVVMQARKEAAIFRLNSSHRRSFVLQWTAAIAQELGAKRIIPYVLLFIMTPVRELTDKGRTKYLDVGVKQNMLVMSEDLLKFIKGLVGVEIFDKLYSKVQLHFTKKRIDRKKRDALIKIKDQALGVKRKLKQNKDKNTLKKKKRRTSNYGDIRTTVCKAK